MEQVKAKKKHVEFDLQKLEGDEQAAMAKMYADTLKNFTEGSIVKGKVSEGESVTLAGPADSVEGRYYRLELDPRSGAIAHLLDFLGG